MRKILIFVLVLISLESFGQNPPNYTNIFGRYRWIAGMFDSGLHVPRYNGVPSGLRVGMSPNDGAMAADTLNGHFYGYWNTAWKRLAYYTDIAAGAVNIYNTSGMLTANRTLTGDANSFSLNLDSLNSFRVQRNGVSRITMNSTLTEIASPNQTAGVSVNNSNSLVSYSANAFRVMADSTTSIRKISYDFPFYTDLLTYYSLTPKYYVDSLVGAGGGGGSGTVNTGAALKAAYYPSAAALVDDWVGVEFGNTNLNTKILAQATTEVGAEIKLQSTPTANALNISSSGGTGDLGSWTAAGYLKAGRIGIPASVAPSYSVDIQDANTGVTSFQISDPGGGQYRFKLREYASIMESFSSSFQINNTFAAGTLSFGAFGATQLLVLNDKRLAFSVRNSEKQGADVASVAGAITLGTDGNTFEITGTNAITRISNSDWQNGAIITLLFTSTASLVDGTANSGTDIGLELLGNVNYNAVAGETITLVLGEIGGTQRWREKGRSRESSVVALNKAVTIEAPSAAEAIDMWQTPVAITVTSLKAILRGSASPSVTYNIRFGTDITSSTDVFTSNITCTSVTTGCSNSSGFNDATIPAGSFIWVITSASSGTINSISLTLNYTED